jgi:hypothetical protein
LNDKDVERVLKSLIDERSLIKLLKFLEKEESIHNCKKIKIRDNIMIFIISFLNHKSFAGVRIK